MSNRFEPVEIDPVKKLSFLISWIATCAYGSARPETMGLPHRLGDRRSIPAVEWVTSR
jgi:hypothetical protein